MGLGWSPALNAVLLNSRKSDILFAQFPWAIFSKRFGFKSMHSKDRLLAAIIPCMLFVVVCTGNIVAQSTDVGSPSPITSNKLVGRIAARDLGDSRLTDHYYAFTGTPGDLLITVQTKNLNGDLDVFTAVTLRPLLKLTLYAEDTKPVTKGIYLRRNEDLILRIEARSPNDDEGSYQLFFGGSFQALAGPPGGTQTENQAATAASPSDRKTNRVNSVGARIAEPTPPPVAAAPTPEATPAESPAVAEKPAKNTAKPPTTPRTVRSPGRRSTATPTPKPKPAETEEAKKVEPADTNPSEPKPKPVPAKPRRAGASSRVSKPAPQPEPESGPRLIIETNDGTLINRFMSGVRRVTVENGQVVVVGKDGKIDRFALANVVRFTIEQ